MAVINHTACLAHHPPATGHTVRVLLDYKSGEEDNRTEEGAIGFNQISALFNGPTLVSERLIHHQPLTYMQRSQNKRLLMKSDTVLGFDKPASLKLIANSTWTLQNDLGQIWVYFKGLCGKVS